MSTFHFKLTSIANPNNSPLKKTQNQNLTAALFVTENKFVWVCFGGCTVNGSSSEPSSGSRCVCGVNYTEWSCSTTSGSTRTAGKTPASGDSSLFMLRPLNPHPAALLPQNPINMMLPRQMILLRCGISGGEGGGRISEDTIHQCLGRMMQHVACRKKARSRRGDGSWL